MTNSQPTSDEREERLNGVDLNKWDAIQWTLNVFVNEEFTFAQKVEALEDYQRRAATAMRDRCVEKVRAMGLWCDLCGEGKQPDPTDGPCTETQHYGKLISALESLTLDQVEQKQP